MINVGDGGIIVKRPLEQLIRQNPLTLLKNGEVYAAELAQEHRLLFIHRDQLNYIRNHNLGERLDKIYSDSIFSLLIKNVIPDSLFYLMICNDGNLSFEDFTAYQDFVDRYYPLLHPNQGLECEVNFCKVCENALNKIIGNSLGEERHRDLLIDPKIKEHMHQTYIYSSHKN